MYEGIDLDESDLFALTFPLQDIESFSPSIC